MIVTGLKDYYGKVGAWNGVTIALSGGADSALALLLADDPRLDGANLGSGWWIVVYDPVTGDLSTYAKPLPVACEGLRIIGGTTAPTGFYIWSSNAGMVFRMAGDPAIHDWELVAGPLDDEIDDLAVQSDGSLIVIRDETVYWHPGRP